MWPRLFLRLFISFTISNRFGSSLLLKSREVLLLRLNRNWSEVFFSNDSFRIGFFRTNVYSISIHWGFVVSSMCPSEFPPHLHLVIVTVVLSLLRTGSSPKNVFFVYGCATEASSGCVLQGCQPDARSAYRIPPRMSSFLHHNWNRKFH